MYEVSEIFSCKRSFFRLYENLKLPLHMLKLFPEVKLNVIKGIWLNAIKEEMAAL